VSVRSKRDVASPRRDDLSRQQELEETPCSNHKEMANCPSLYRVWYSTVTTGTLAVNTSNVSCPKIQTYGQLEDDGMCRILVDRDAVSQPSGWLISGAS
jgi:hypothetical protein